jgi:hypothetical protein
MQFSSDAAAARDAQQLLQAAHLQAQRKEAEVLAAADAGTQGAVESYRTTGITLTADHQLTSQLYACVGGQLFELFMLCLL